MAYVRNRVSGQGIWMLQRTAIEKCALWVPAPASNLVARIASVAGDFFWRAFAANARNLLPERRSQATKVRAPIAKP